MELCRLNSEVHVFTSTWMRRSSVRFMYSGLSENTLKSSSNPGLRQQCSLSPSIYRFFSTYTSLSVSLSLSLFLSFALFLSIFLSIYLSLLTLTLLLYLITFSFFLKLKHTIKTVRDIVPVGRVGLPALEHVIVHVVGRHLRLRQP